MCILYINNMYMLVWQASLHIMSTFTFGTGQQPQINRLHVVKVHSLPHAMLRTVGANSSYCNDTFFFFFFCGSRSSRRTLDSQSAGGVFLTPSWIIAAQTEACTTAASALLFINGMTMTMTCPSSGSSGTISDILIKVSVINKIKWS